MSRERSLSEILDDIAALPEGENLELHSKTLGGAIRFHVADSRESELHLLNLAKELHKVMCNGSKVTTTSIIKDNLVVWQATTRE